MAQKYFIMWSIPKNTLLHFLSMYQVIKMYHIINLNITEKYRIKVHLPTIQRSTNIFVISERSKTDNSIRSDSIHHGRIDDLVN